MLVTECLKRSGIYKRLLSYLLNGKDYDDYDNSHKNNESDKEAWTHSSMEEKTSQNHPNFVCLGL